MQFKKKAWLVTLLASLSASGYAQQQSQANNNDEDTVEVIEVLGTFSENLIKALDEKRFSDNVVDVILAEDIGKFPDLTTSDALQRIPGVQVARGAGETNNVVVRGLPDIATTINGRSIFTTNNRGFAFQDLPAEALAGIEAYKSRSADQIEGGIAGLVNIRLRKALDFEGFKAAVSGRITDDQYAGDTDKTLTGLLSNRWRSDLGEFGALINMSTTKDYFQQSNTFTAETLPSTNTPDGSRIGIPLSVGIVSDKGLRERFQANLSLQYKPNDETEVYLDGIHSTLDLKQHTIFGLGFVYDNPLENIVVDPNTDLCNTIDDGAPVCYAASGTAKNTQFLSGTHGITSAVNIDQVAIGVDWSTDRMKINSEVVRTDTDRQYERFIQDWHYYGIDLNFISNVDNHTSFNVVQGGTLDPNNFVSGGLFQPWDDSTGDETAWTADMTYNLDSGFFVDLEAGIRIADRGAVFAAGDMGTFEPGNNRPASDFGEDYLIPVDLGGATYLDLPGFVAVDYEYMLANKDAIRQIYGLPAGGPDADPLRGFEASEKSAAIYAQTKYETEIAGLTVNGRVGARVIQVERKLSSFGLVAGDVTLFTETTNETNFLPNASLNLYFSENVVLRSSVSKTISQPAFSDLNPNLFYFPPSPGTPVGSGSGGNPDLDPIESISYDLSLEYYPQEGGIASMALFYRDIQGYISVFSEEEMIDGQRYNISRPFSSGKGYLQGAELSYTKFFKQLPAPFDGFGVQLNYTYIDGEVSLPDGNGSSFKTELAHVSKNNGNAVLMYEAEKLFARIAYNYRGDYIESFQTPGIQQPNTSNVRASGRIDASVGYNVSESLRITLDGTNLNDEKYYNYWGDSARSRDRRDGGRTISLGIAYNF